MKMKILEKYGYTEECQGCKFKNAGFSVARSHSEVCQARITKAMEVDEEGREQIRRETERIAAHVRPKSKRRRSKATDRTNQITTWRFKVGVLQKMPDAGGAGMTEQAEGGERERRTRGVG